MSLRKFRSQPIRLVAILLSASGMMHYLISLRWWIVLCGDTKLLIDQAVFWNILTYAWFCLACLGAFTASLVLSSFNRRCAVAFLSLALLASPVGFFYDTKNNRSQI